MGHSSCVRSCSQRYAGLVDRTPGFTCPPRTGCRAASRSRFSRQLVMAHTGQSPFARRLTGLICRHPAHRVRFRSLRAAGFADDADAVRIGNGESLPFKGVLDLEAQLSLDAPLLGRECLHQHSDRDLMWSERLDAGYLISGGAMITPPIFGSSWRSAVRFRSTVMAWSTSSS